MLNASATGLLAKGGQKCQIEDMLAATVNRLGYMKGEEH